MSKFVKNMITALSAVIIIAALAFSAGAVEMKTGIGIVEGSSLRLRAKPNTDAEILATASYGDSVVIIKEVDGWYLVDYNLHIGYMSAEYVQFKDRENVELGNGVVEESVVNMRSTPSSDGDLLAQLTIGDEAYIIGFNCGWYKVKYDGQTGYIRSDLLALTEAPAANSQNSVGEAPVVISAGQKLVNYSMDFLGIPYVWGGTTTNGFDCSGFTQYVFRDMGYKLKRTAEKQYSQGTSVKRSELEVGDLVFFGNTYASSSAITHVGIYIGNNEFIHAGGNNVKITSMDDAYYAVRYVGAKRVI